MPANVTAEFDGGRIFVDGQFRRADEVEPVIEAATGEPLGNGSAATVSELDDAVAAARAGLAGWRATPASERTDLLMRFADALAARAGLAAYQTLKSIYRVGPAT